MAFPEEFSLFQSPLSLKPLFKLNSQIIFFQDLHIRILIMKNIYKNLISQVTTKLENYFENLGKENERKICFTPTPLYIRPS